MNIATGECHSSDEENYYVEIYKRRDVLHFHVAVPKDYINSWKSGHKCEHDGCFKDGSVECHVPAEQDIELIEHLCQGHAYEAGYCSLCGSFWGGIESFDFDNPSHLCEHCLEQVKDEIGEDDDVNGENEDEYYP